MALKPLNNAKERCTLRTLWNLLRKAGVTVGNLEWSELMVEQTVPKPGKQGISTNPTSQFANGFCCLKIHTDFQKEK